jgi:hypothetical protein
MPSKHCFRGTRFSLIGTIATLPAVLMLLLTSLLACTADGTEAPRSEGDIKPLATSATDPSQPTRFDATGFAEAPGRSVVIANCTGCHSGRLVQQNRATRAGWHEIIRWMQAKQGLWRLEAQTESEILDYLAAEYGPANDSEDGRRPALKPKLMPPLTTSHDVESAVQRSKRGLQG